MATSDLRDIPDGSDDHTRHPTRHKPFADRNKVLIAYNYMFMMDGDGTPYELLFSLVGGSAVWYPIGVVMLFLLYITAFYGVVLAIRRCRR